MIKRSIGVLFIGEIIELILATQIGVLYLIAPRRPDIKSSGMRSPLLYDQSPVINIRPGTQDHRQHPLFTGAGHSEIKTFSDSSENPSNYKEAQPPENMIKVSVSSDTSKHKSMVDSIEPAPSNEEKPPRQDDDRNIYSGFEYIEEIQVEPLLKPRYKTSEHKSQEG